ncbi:glycosyl transferase family protein [Legionella londiniensis]|uniref:Bacteriophage N4 adsorption protein B n=1 Tax=Legionella londiniensis TaxID=45068 RepID=A0A0W0VID4_9GAMM|nr:glycosyl transferase family protein [Legionella londiniensis]KTD19877.1 bacteriophage N4 adsorption protein B [Legionella londiniensis]STX94251.1 bacteriophage N4 adsorption protein B [Legionella londiniensis]
MDIYNLIIVIYLVMWYLLIFLAVLFVLSGIDDLFFDIYYWIRYVIRKWKLRKFEPLTYEKLLSVKEKRIAVLIPCWHEAGVIGNMLRNNCYAIDYENYCLFVGVYPNDPETVKEVQEAASVNPHVRCVIGETPGPTNKAANLNTIYQYVKEYEKKSGLVFEIFVFHDAEDIIHPLSFRLYNYLIPQKQMIQIPIFPLAVSYWNFTHWLYADEFSENHTKDIIVRESIHGHVPSAGVGTAFWCGALEALSDPKTGLPFSVDSLTEDYRTSLMIRMLGLKQIFVTQTVERMKWKRRGIFRRRYVLEKEKEYVATRALFPMEYKKAVRQKARWIIGIVFQEWLHAKWPKSWPVRFTLLHDRKSFITHFINGFGYFVFLFWFFYTFLTYEYPQYPSLQEQFNFHPWVWWLVVIVTLLMVQRLMQRFIAIARIYGLVPAILSIPRVFYGNLLNLHALLRAYKVYFSSPKKKASTQAQPNWDKTDHQFPGSHILIPYRRRLGDILLENKLITERELNQAAIEQQKTGERLGQVLRRLNLVDEKTLLRLLSKQYKLKIFPKSRIPPQVEGVSLKLQHWAEQHQAKVIAHEKNRKMVAIGIEDPTNEFLIESIIHRFKPLKPVFVLIDKEN